MNGCLTPKWAIFLAVSWREQVTFRWDDDHWNNSLCLVQSKHAKWDFYNASSLKQHSMGRHVAPLLTHYPDSKPISLCSFSLMPENQAANTISSDSVSNQRSTTLKASMLTIILWFTIIEWLSDCCLMPNELYFSYIIARINYIWTQDPLHPWQVC